MIRRRTYALIVVAGALLGLVGVNLGIGAPDTSLPGSVISGGGGTQSSTNYVLRGTAGQSSAIGPHGSTNYGLQGGYWHTLATDTDADGWANFRDNCPADPNPTQANNDGDSMGDACDPDDDNDGVLDTVPDNCQFVANPGQDNSDSDAWGDACDGCPTTNTVWYTPSGDGDCDAFPSSAYDPGTKRAAESVMGTDPDDACADTTALNDETPDPWPMDNNDDRNANLSDILGYIPVFLTPAPRFDLNGDGIAALADVLMYIPFFGMTCTP